MTKKYKVIWVDPPMGWLYGFPKNVDKYYHDLGEDKTQWYADNGYPQELLDSGQLRYVRVGLEEINDGTNI